MTYATVHVRRLMSADDAAPRLGRRVPELEPSVTAAAVYRDADTGEVILAYLPLGDVSDLRRAVRGLKYGINPRNGDYGNVSRTFGFSPRKAIHGREGCQPTALAAESPDQHAVLTGYSGRLTRMLAEFAPDIAARDFGALAGVRSDWRLGGDTLWTSGVVNRSSRLPYHRDRFNFPTWSAMPVLRRHMTGGYLDVPEYGLTVACRDGYAVFFAGHELVHGVTPMQPTRPDGYRYSVVYYALKGMKDCQPTGTPVRVPAAVSRAGGGGRGRQQGGFAEVPIETLTVGDKVVTWGRQTADLRSRGRKITKTGSRPYEGPLVTVNVDGRHSRYTPEHHCIVDFGPDLDEGNCIVYLMQRGGQYRIGRTAWSAHGGLRMRAQQEAADAAWVLSAHRTVAEAGLAEAVASATFGIPGISFVEGEHYAFPLEDFWSKIGSNRAQAQACLAHFGRLIDRPLLRRPEQRGRRWLPAEGVAAANLVSGMMLPVPAGEPVFDRGKSWLRWPTEWRPAIIGREFYSGLVHSLEVEQDHNYVADGIVTHNCFTAAVETEYAKRRRTERERAMAQEVGERA